MTDYRKPQGDLLYDLIEESNPGFKSKFSQSDYILDSVTAYTPGTGEIQNTTIRCRAKPGGRALGSKTLKYRRIAMASILRGVTVKLTNWAPTTTLTIAEVLTTINAMYGLTLVPSDIPATSTITQGNVNLGVTGSNCYTGIIALNWTKGKRNLSDAITAVNGSSNLNGRLWPGGNTFGGARKPQGDFATYGADLSSQSATLNGLIASGTATTGVAWLTNVATELNAQYGSSFFSSNAATTQGGMGGLTYAKVTLPNAAYPDANSAKYNRAIVLTAAADSWFQGKLYLHFNV